MAEGEPVRLFIYDLSGGMARAFSQMLLGRQIEAIYHTSVVVDGMEFYFGGGLNVARAGSTPFGRPMEVLELGRTQLPQEMREELLAELSERYTPASYNLWANNCNNFSDEFAQLLCGAGVPPHITGLPQDVLQTPFGQMIAPMLSGLERQLGSMQQQAYRPAAAALAPPAGSLAASGTPAAAVEAPAAPAVEPAVAEAPAQAAAAEEGPALQAAEVEIEAAVAAGMMQDAQEQLQGLRLQQPAAADVAAGAAEAPPAVAAGAAAAAPAAGQEQAAQKLATELAVEAEFKRLMAGGQLEEHEAQALALEAVAQAQHRQTDNPAQHQHQHGGSA